MQMSMPDLNAIRSHLGESTWTVRVFDEVTSTNTLLKELGRQGAPAGTVLVADRQTGGRGRLGRTFLSPGGVGVYLSALIRPDCAPTELMHLTCAVAVAMCDAVEHAFGFRPQIKWTNDLVVGTKKLGGILTELGLDPKTGRVSYAVLGIGINCGQLEADFDESIRGMATSARMVLGHAAAAPETSSCPAPLRLSRQLMPIALFGMSPRRYSSQPSARLPLSARNFTKCRVIHGWSPW